MSKNTVDEAILAMPSAEVPDSGEDSRWPSVADKEMRLDGIRRKIRHNESLTEDERRKLKEFMDENLNSWDIQDGLEIGCLDERELKDACRLWVKACHSLRPFKYVFVGTTAAVLIGSEIHKHVQRATYIQILVETTAEELKNTLENNLIPQHRSTLSCMDGTLYITINSPLRGSGGCEIQIPVRFYITESKSIYALTIDQTTYRPWKTGERTDDSLQSINTVGLDSVSGATRIDSGSGTTPFEEFYSSFDDENIPLLKSTALLRAEILSLHWKIAPENSLLDAKVERCFENFGVFLDDPTLDEDAKGFEDEEIQALVIEMIRRAESRFIIITSRQCDDLGKLGLSSEALKEAVKAYRQPLP